MHNCRCIFHNTLTTRGQNRRIHDEVREGDISRAQAAKLHKDDRKIRREERMMASQNNGHITKQERRTLNQQENQEQEDRPVSRRYVRRARRKARRYRSDESYGRSVPRLPITGAMRSASLSRGPLEMTMEYAKRRFA